MHFLAISSRFGKKAHHKAKKNYNKYLNTKDEDKYRIVYTDKQALYESSTEEYTLQVEKFNQAQARVFRLYGLKILSLDQ